MSNNWKENTILYKLFFTEIWHLAFIKSSILFENFNQNHIKIQLTKKNFFKDILPPISYSFLADPFGVFIGDYYYLYFEYLNYRKKKGEIHCHKYDKNLDLVDKNVLIRKDYHLSYPYPFVENNDIYILPEMVQSNGNQAIFKFHKDSISYQEKLLNIKALLDPCLTKYNNHYYILGSINGKKHAFMSKKILGDYKEIKYISHHQYNQSGGKIVNYNNNFFRPLQISNITYGEKTLFTKIIFQKDKVTEGKNTFTIESKSHYQQ